MMKIGIGNLKKIVIASIWILLYSPIIVSAEETAVETSQMEFSVKAIIPDNQENQEHTYFDLKMEASQKQIVNVLVANLSNREIKVEAQIHSATTNMNGVVEYGKRDVPADSTLMYRMEDIVTCDSLITVPANGEVLLALHIQMPEDEYEGVIAGGITFNLVESEETEEVNSDTGMRIQNIYSYVLGIVLHENEKVVIPALELGDISYEEADGISTINANIQNSAAVYAENLEIEAWVIRRGTKGTLYQVAKENMRMAPNSNFDFQIDLNGSLFNEGDFTLYITANVEGIKWKWEKDFTIDTGKLHAEETRIIYEEKSTGYLWLFAVIPAVFFIAIIIVYRYKKMLKIKKKRKKAIMKEF